VDKQLETGEFFLNERARLAAKRAEKREKQAAKVEAVQQRRAAAFVPPTEPEREKKTAKRPAEPLNVEAIKKKMKKSQKRS